jgi:hypothetical protein
MVDFLIQIAVPVITKLNLIKAGWGAGFGLIVAVGIDLHSFGQAPAGTKWSWKLTAAHAAYGAIGGFLGTFGLAGAIQ